MRTVWKLVALVTIGGIMIGPCVGVAAARTHGVGHDRVHVSASSPAQIAPGGFVLVLGHATGAEHLRIRLQELRGRRWHTVAGAADRDGSFVLSVRAPHRQLRLLLRVLAVRGHRVLASARVRQVQVRRGAPTTAGPDSAASVIAPTSVEQVPATGAAGPVVLAGNQSFSPGSVVASSVGPATPNGFLGKVVSVSHASGATIVQTVPTTLEAALPAGSFDLNRAVSVGPPAAQDLGRREQTARASGANKGGAFNSDIAKSLSCNGGASFEASGKVGISATPKFSLSWSWLHGISASFTETVQAFASLSGTLSASGACALDKTPLLAHPAPLGTFAADVLGLPVVVTIEGQIYVDGSAAAQGSVTAGVQGALTASGGIKYARGKASIIAPSASLTVGPEGPTVKASARVGAHVTPELQVLLYGAGGPVFDATTGLDFSADINQNPWWALTAPLTVTARLAAPDFDLSTPALTLYSHTFHIAQASGPFTAPPPPPTVPASGPTLVYQGSTAGNPDTGDLTYSDWSNANGESIDVEDALPADLSPYRCVVVDLNEAFASGDQAALAGYLNEGGTIVALGEHADNGGGFDTADAALNAMAGALGSDITLNDDTIDAGDTVTTNIDTSPLTNNVSSIGYNWASTLSLGSAAHPLVESADGSSTIIAADSIGAGTFVMSGDSNVFSDNNDGFYVDDGNGQLVQNLCP